MALSLHRVSAQGASGSSSGRLLGHNISPSELCLGSGIDTILARLSPTDDTPFPFLNLPLEIRNEIYEYLLTPIHRRQRHIKKYSTQHSHDVNLDDCITDQVDRVLLGNDLWLRNLRRQRSRPWANCIDLRIRFQLLSSSPGIIARLNQPACAQPALMETGILRLCQQIYAEAKHVLYSKNTFAVIVPFIDMRDMFGGIPVRPFHHYFPPGTDLARIEHFRLEVQLHAFGSSETPTYCPVDVQFSSFEAMHNLKTLQIIVTFKFVGREDISTEMYREGLRELARAIPAHVQKVTWGMTPEEVERGDFGGDFPVDGSVL